MEDTNLTNSTEAAGDASEITAKNPDFALAELRYLYSVADHTGGDKEALKQQLLDEIKNNNMAPFYSQLCEQFKWPIDNELLQTMTTANEAILKELSDKLKAAEETEGESEVREALLHTAELHTRIGEKAKAELAFRKTAEKTVGLGQQLDIVFSLIRIGFFHNDHDLVVRNIAKAKDLLEMGGADWDRKNKLKVYEALHLMQLRNFKKSAELFLDTLSTFTSYELFEYNTFIFYAVLTSIVSLGRPKLREKIIDAPEVLAVIKDIPHLQSFLNSFYNSDYKEFFVALAHISDRVKRDWFLGPHNRYFTREMRILAYAQLLESYRSVQLSSMAQAFGVSTEFLDNELSRFIAAGRLHCKIDKVGGIVETNRPDLRNAQYQATIRQGDLLLNRIQKLSRVINV